MSSPVLQRVLTALTSVAPDIDPQSVSPQLTLREQFDFDSMDTLHFAIALKHEFGIDIPDADFRELATVQRCVAYLQTKLPAAPPGSANVS